MKIARCKIKSLSPYSQSRKIQSPRFDKESFGDYEKRVWRERIHADDDGNVYISPMAFKFSLETAARFLRLKIPGLGNSEYGKHFKAGVIVPNPPMLGITVEEVEGEWLNLHANGKRGSATRVDRCMPVVRKWATIVDFYVLDDTIPRDVFERVLTEAGNFIGVGRFRPENGGFYGRYELKSVEWSER